MELADGSAVFNLSTAGSKRAKGYTRRHLARIDEIVTKHEAEFLRRWHEYFDHARVPEGSRNFVRMWSVAFSIWANSRNAQRPDQRRYRAWTTGSPHAASSSMSKAEAMVRSCSSAVAIGSWYASAVAAIQRSLSATCR